MCAIQTSYIAHTREDGAEQPLKDHLENVAVLAQRFAEPFGAGEIAYLVGLLHDLGKYSDPFQRRIRGEAIRVDHSTAGGQLISPISAPNPVVAYPVMGHHSGLPNGGSLKWSQAEDADGTLFARLKKKIPPFDAYKQEIALPQPAFPDLQDMGNPGFTIAFFIRMLYATLVDADFLDTENFMTSGDVVRSGYDTIATLYDCFLTYIKRFKNPKTTIHEKRNGILANCLKKAEDPQGLFSLTVPTGGGKTIASLGFALKHATKHNKKRIIYIIPYTSIIEQNAAVFAEILSAENVLEHHSGVVYEPDENGENKKYLSTENWDAPVVVTTNVQFFESLFSNRSSKCRKLHNIANSVLIFDEAQMLPISYMQPCINAIVELVTNYSCTAVLCTATQPALDGLLPEQIKKTEICENPEELYGFFSRAKISNVGQLTDDQLIGRLRAEKQVLCIVNSRKHAQNLFVQINDGYHLSTLMTPAHRKAVLSKIREDLQKGKACKVIATSLVEAGVDLDFPTVYRAKNGLDSVIQAAGRCNREGKNQAGGNVYVFEEDAAYTVPEVFAQPIAGYDLVAREYAEVNSTAAIHRYFEWLYTMRKGNMDVKKIIQACNDGWQKAGGSLPFADIARDFRLIENDTFAVF